MKPHLGLVALLALPCFAATPPSLVDKVFRGTTFFSSTRTTHEWTLVFQPNGQFTRLVDASGSVLEPAPNPRKVFLTPTVDGTYVYRRIDDTTAYVDLNYDDGTKGTFPIPSDAIFASDQATWQLTDATTLAPVTNLSLRGRVTPGHPLIAGLVIGGTPKPQTQFVPAAGELRREVLIRVVGPGLASFNVDGVWADPDFQLFSGVSPAEVNEAHYGDWTVPPHHGNIASDPVTETEFRKIFKAVGAFPLASGSKDAAAVVRLNPGAYTIVCTAPAGDAGGEALIEVYLLP